MIAQAERIVLKIQGNTIDVIPTHNDNMPKTALPP